MIKSKSDLRYYLREDYNRIGRKLSFINLLTGSEGYRVYRYFKNLRYLEYYKNNNTEIINKILYIYRLFKHRHYSLRFNITVAPNSIGPGFLFVHPGFLRLSGPPIKIGKNCTILPNVLFGNKKPNMVEDTSIIVGDNCYISTNVTVLGPVTIGNNVTIAAGAVVTQDVPDNCIVGGIPAKVLKQNVDSMINFNSNR